MFLQPTRPASAATVSFATHVMVFLIGVLVFSIIDLDRPHRGLIRVPQDSLIALKESLSAPAS